MCQWSEYYARILPLARERARKPGATEEDRKVYWHVVHRKAVFHHSMRSRPRLQRQLLMRQAMPESQMLEAMACELLRQ